MRDIGKPRICRRNLILDTGIESDKSLVVKLDPLTLDRAQNWASGLWHSDVGRLPNIFGADEAVEAVSTSFSSPFHWPRPRRANVKSQWW